MDCDNDMALCSRNVSCGLSLAESLDDDNVIVSSRIPGCAHTTLVIVALCARPLSLILAFGPLQNSTIVGESGESRGEKVQGPVNTVSLVKY